MNRFGTLLCAALFVGGPCAASHAATQDAPAQTVMDKASGKLVSVAVKEPILIDPTVASYKPAAPLKGRIRIGGTAFIRQVADVAEILKAHHPDAIVNIDNSERNIGLARLAAGDLDILTSRTQLTDAELAQFRKATGEDPVVISIAKGNYSASHGGAVALAVIVNESNPLNSLTLAQIDAVYSTTRNLGYPLNIDAWQQVGIKGDYDRQPIHLYGMQKDSIRSVAFQQLAMARGEFKDGVSRLPAEDDVAKAVANDKLGIGFIELIHPQPGVKVLSISEALGRPAQPVSIRGILSNEYPLFHGCYYVLRKHPGQPLGALTKEFIRLSLSREGQNAAVKWRYLPLNGKEVAAMNDLVGGM